MAGGDYRMVVAFDRKRSIAFVKFVGTDVEYDKIDAPTVSLFDYAYWSWCDAHSSYSD